MRVCPFGPQALISVLQQPQLTEMGPEAVRSCGEMRAGGPTLPTPNTCSPRSFCQLMRNERASAGLSFLLFSVPRRAARGPSKATAGLPGPRYLPVSPHAAPGWGPSVSTEARLQKQVLHANSKACLTPGDGSSGWDPGQHRPAGRPRVGGPGAAPGSERPPPPQPPGLPGQTFLLPEDLETERRAAWPGCRPASCHL